jgi:replicative DNA helicase
MEILVVQDFYNNQHKLIFQAMIDLNQQGRRVDLLSLQDALVKKNELDHWWYYLLDVASRGYSICWACGTACQIIGKIHSA